MAINFWYHRASGRTSALIPCSSQKGGKETILEEELEFKGIEEEEEEIAEERSSAEGDKDKGEQNVSEFNGKM